MSLGPNAVNVYAEAVACTGRAVAIRWTTASGVERTVLASAVEPQQKHCVGAQ